MTFVEDTRRVAVPEAVILRELDGEAVLLNLESEQYFGLDEVGTRFVMALTAGVSIGAALDAVLVEYAVEPEVLKRDCEGLLEQMKEKGLLEIIE